MITEGEGDAAATLTELNSIQGGQFVLPSVSKRRIFVRRRDRT